MTNQNRTTRRTTAGGRVCVQLALSALCCLILQLLAGTTPAAGQEWNWKPVRLGAGGYVTGIDIHADGTRVVRTDAYGAYRWNTSKSQWEQLLTTKSLPRADWNLETYDSDPGVYEIKIAPTNSNIMYMVFDGKVFKTTDAGANWTRTNFKDQNNMDPNDWTDLARLYAGKMAIDPSNADVVYVGTVSNGLQYTRDGGTTWYTAPTVPNGTAVPGISGICFANSNTIYAASKGNGVYRTINGGSSWAEITTGGDPRNVTDGECYQGSYFVVNGGVDAGNVWEWDGSTWTQRSSDGRGQAIAGDPETANRLALLNGFGGVQVSRDGGANWDPIRYRPVTVGDNIPWHGFGPTSYLASADMMFDPHGATGELYLAQGRGVWKSTLPTGALPGPIEWTETSVGIEELVVNEIVAPPNESYVHACAYDFGTFSFPDPDKYLDQHGTTSTDNQDCMGFAYAATDDTNPTLVALSQHTDGQFSATSTTRGTTWVPITDLPTRMLRYGTVAASTATNFVGYLGSRDQPIYYTKNGGTTWNTITDFDGAVVMAQWYNRHIIAADYVTSGKFWLYHVDGNTCSNPDDGLWRTTDGGDNWTKLTMNTGTYIVSCVFDRYQGRLRATPEREDHLWWTPGGATGGEPRPESKFMRSTDGGKTWTDVNVNVREVKSFGFGSTFGSYPRIYIAGWVSNVWGIWYSDNAGGTWTQISGHPHDSFDRITVVEGAKDGTERVYVGFRGSGAAYAEPAVSGRPPAPNLLP